VGGAEERTARKTIERVERRLQRVGEQEARLHDEMAQHASDHERLQRLTVELGELSAEKDALEAEWLEAASVLE
jgi:ATP-binding cassette subfamily F protein uup